MILLTQIINTKNSEQITLTFIQYWQHTKCSRRHCWMQWKHKPGWAGF